MIRLPRDIEPRDIQQWLGNTVFLYEREGRRTPAILELHRETDAYTEKTNPETLERCILVRCGDKGYREKEWAPINYVFCYWPLGGSINMPGIKAATHITRKAQKQFRRSLYGGVLSYYTPKYWELRAKIGDWRVAGLQRLCPATIDALFNPVYWPVGEALSRLNYGWHSVAINPRVIVAGGKHGKRMVYYQGEFVATADFNTFFPQCDKLTTTLLERAFEGELQCQNL